MCKIVCNISSVQFGSPWCKQALLHSPPAPPSHGCVGILVRKWVDRMYLFYECVCWEFSFLLQFCIHVFNLLLQLQLAICFSRVVVLSLITTIEEAAILLRPGSALVQVIHFNIGLYFRQWGGKIPVINLWGICTSHCFGELKLTMAS